MSAVYIARRKQVAARMLGGEMMIMSARDSTLFSLNETASAIWQAADGSTPLDGHRRARRCARSLMWRRRRPWRTPRNWCAIWPHTASC